MKKLKCENKKGNAFIPYKNNNYMSSWLSEHNGFLLLLLIFVREIEKIS